MTFRNFTAKTRVLHQFLHSCFCRFFLIRATSHRRLLVTSVESFSLARQKINWKSGLGPLSGAGVWTNNELRKRPRCVLAQLTIIDGARQIEPTKSANRTNPKLVHASESFVNTCRTQVGAGIAREMRKKVRGCSLIARRSCAAPWFSWTLKPNQRQMTFAANCTTQQVDCRIFGASHGKVLMLFDLYEQTASITKLFFRFSLTDVGAETFSINGHINRL